MDRDERGQGRIMDWLKKLPLVGPWVSRLMTTHAWRSYERLDRVKWTRLAAAMTFTSFVALFPLLSLAAAIAAATLSKDQQDQLQDKIAEQIPGISDQLNIQSLIDNAGTVGLISGALLLFTGIGWVDATRAVCAPSGSCRTRRRTPSCTGPRTAASSSGSAAPSWSPSPSPPSPRHWSAGSSGNWAWAAASAACSSTSPRSPSPCSPTSSCCCTS